MICGNYDTHRQTHSASTILTLPSSGNLKWINNGYKPNSQGYGKSKTVTWLFPAPWQSSLLFERLKPFLTVGLIISQKKKKKKVKMCFLQSPVIREPTLPNWSYRHWQKASQTSWRLLFLLTSSVNRQRPQNKGINCMGLNRLLNMTTIFMTFCLTYYWLLIFVFRYKKALLKTLMV